MLLLGTVGRSRESAGLVVVTGAGATAAVAANVTLPDTCEDGPARLVVMLLPDTAVLGRKALKLFVIMKRSNVGAVGIGRPDAGDIDLPTP